MKFGISKPTRRWTMAIAAALLAGVGVGLATPANAGTALSSFGYFTVAGNQYVNYAAILTSTGHAQASTTTSFSSGSTPTGYAGSRGRLFTSGGSLSCEGANTYNPGPSYSAIGYSCTRTSSGAWYSYGVSLGFNGSGYNSYYTYQSPNQNS